MPHEKGEKARIALLIVVAVLAIALAMLEALADNPPSPALNPSETPEDEPTYSRASAQRSSELS